MNRLFVLIFGAMPAIQAFGWSMLSGVVGVWILAGFFSVIMSLELLSMVLPLVVGVNASFSGYMLIERNAGDFARPRWTCAGLGLLMALVALAAINWFCMATGEFVLLSGAQGLAGIALAIIGAWLGGVLAIKQRQLAGQTTKP